MNNTKVKTRYHLNGSGNLLVIRQTWDLGTPQKPSQNRWLKNVSQRQRGGRWGQQRKLVLLGFQGLVSRTHLGRTGSSLSRRTCQLMVQNVMVKSYWGSISAIHRWPLKGKSPLAHISAQKTCKYTSVPTRPEARVTGSWSAVTVTLTCDTDCLFLMEQRQERTDHSWENSGLNGPFHCLLLRPLL